MKVVIVGGGWAGCAIQLELQHKIYKEKLAYINKSA